MTFIRVFQRTLFVFLLSVALPSLAADHVEYSPRIAPFLQHMRTRLASVMDFRKGGGTGELAREARRFATELKAKADAITSEDAEKLGLNIETLRQMALDMNGGLPIEVEVHQYEEAVRRANERLRNAGYDFFRLVQTDESRLIELFRIFASRFPSKTVTVEDLETASRAVYPHLPVGHIRIPLLEKEVQGAREKLSKESLGRLHFYADARVRSAAEVVLPPIDAPSESKRKIYSRLKIARNVISPALALVAGVSSSVGWADGAIAVTKKVIPGAVSGALAAGLEIQFIQFSNRWASFWSRFGLPGNIAVNASYGTLVTAAGVMTELAMGLTPEMTWEKFLKKTLVIGTVAFVGSFGNAQIISAKMRDQGELTEAGRFLFETVSVLTNNFGRVLALTGAGLGLASEELFKFWGMPFGTAEAIGFGIQLGYFSVITVPLGLKYLWGESAYDAGTRNMLLGNSMYAEPKAGPVTATCRWLLGGLANLYTPRRKTIPED